MKLQIFKPSNVRIEAIDPDSLEDAFEVIEDEIEREFKIINKLFGE